MSIEKNKDALEFALEYKNLATKTLKSNYIKDHLVVESYVSIMTKINTCENLIHNTMQDIEDDKIKGFKMNTPVMYIIYSLQLVNLYTNLIVDFSNAAGTFDALNESGSLSEILKKIPESETKEFAEIRDMVQKDFLSNKFNIYNFAEEQITKATILFGTCANDGLDKLNNFLDNLDKERIEKSLSKWTSKFDGILKRIGF